jgi:NAD+--asparagine ADP-ribosyltransferase
MADFNDDDFKGDEFGDDFFGRWEEFNRMINDRRFRRDFNKWQKDIEDLMKMINDKNGDNPLKFQFINLTPRENDFNIPEEDMNTEKGKDENGEWESKNWTSEDGSISFSSFMRSSSPGDVDKNEDDMKMPEEWTSRFKDSYKKRPNFEELKKVKLEKLKKTLDYLVENEKYEKAAEVKKMIDELNSDKKEN